jgi:Na+-translocating ferredoxin:NAD+ oxidoreductase RnfG subunit
MKAKKYKLVILIFLLLGSLNSYSQISKKADREIKKVFSIEKYELSKAVDHKIEDFLTKRLLKISNDSNKIGYAYFGTAPSQTKYFDYLVLFDQNLIIKSIKILVYREDYGGEIESKNWLSQFLGKSIVDRFIYRKNIAAISGATISVNSLTEAVNDILSYLTRLKNQGII